MTSSTLTPIDAPPARPTPPPRSARERCALGALLVATAVFYLWDIGVNGWANDFYATAVRAMTKDWKAFLFASLDAGNTITVDKPPAALWVMALSGRIFGFSSWSLLAPQALMAVATVALLYAAVRRVAGPGAGLLAGTALALTPVAVLMFRFDNPDALLVLLMVAAAWATVRALDGASTRWLLLAGLLIGFAFLAKMAQAFVVVPALALAYLVAAPTGLRRRIGQLLGAGAAIVVGAGWWVAIAELWPAADRPYIGGSTTNSVLQLALGYNGFGRIFGGERGGPAPAGEFPGPDAFGGPGGPGGSFGGPGGGFGGAAGFGRLFTSEIGGQAAWLLPAALVLLVVGVWVLRRAPRTDRVRASLILWGAWTVVTFLVFSFAQGIFHPYYTVALAPGIAAVVGIGWCELWRRRATWLARAGLAATVAVTAAWAFVLLARTPEFLPWLRWVVLAAGVAGALGTLLPARARPLAVAVLVACAVAGFAGPTAYAVQTVATSHIGPIPSAGPAVADARRGMVFPGEPGRDRPGREAADSSRPGLVRIGGPGEPQTVDAALVTLLRTAGTDWSAATVGAQRAGALVLASDTDVLPIGGFSGSDPAPTLAAFQADVAAGRVRYFVTSTEPDGPGPGMPGAGVPGPDAADPGRAGFGGGRGQGGAIATWVQQTFTPMTVGTSTVYDLTAPK